MALQGRRLKRLALAAFASALIASPVVAFEDLSKRYGDQLRAAQSNKLPASYRIVRNQAQQPAKVANRYYGGAIRVIYLDGKAVRMPESEIVENMRAGHFVPVYQETGQPLSKEDWVVSLPAWLGSPTVAVAR